VSKALLKLTAILSLAGMASVLSADADLFPAVSKDKTGYIDKAGKLVIPCQFEDGRGFSGELAAVLVDGKWGYVDRNGKIVIAPRYQTVGDFSGGMASVSVSGKFGFINKEGKVVVDPEYDRVSSFSEGLAVVEVRPKKSVVIDATGKEVPNFEPYKADLAGFHEGLVLAHTCEEGVPVFLDTAGKVAIRLARDTDGFLTQCEPFSDGLAAVGIKGKWGFIDKTGAMVIPPEYARVTAFHDGLACAYTEEMKDNVGHITSFIIDRTGAKKHQVPWLATWPFSEGLAPIMASLSDKDKHRFWSAYGYMNTRGELAIQPQFRKAMPFQNGLARVQIDGNDAYVDKDGRQVWTGIARGNERLTSFSGKSMIEIYMAGLEEEDGQTTPVYIRKMTREELVEGSLKTLAWLLAKPERTASRDFGRAGVIGMVAVAPFFQTYCRSFLGEKTHMDPGPFRKLLVDKTLDLDFRRSLVECYGHGRFYRTSWDQLPHDVEVLCALVCDSDEDEALRNRASDALFSHIRGLFLELSNDIRRKNTDSEDLKSGRPDIASLLGADPCLLTPEQKLHGELLVAAMENASSSVLRLLKEAKTEGTRRSAQGALVGATEFQLIRDTTLLQKISKLKDEDGKTRSQEQNEKP
jgi:hypothetical protein